LISSSVFTASSNFSHLSILLKIVSIFLLSKASLFIKSINFCLSSPVEWLFSIALINFQKFSSHTFLTTIFIFFIKASLLSLLLVIFKFFKISEYQFSILSFPEFSIFLSSCFIHSLQEIAFA
jgi:hypothetical protein